MIFVLIMIFIFVLVLVFIFTFVFVFIFVLVVIRWWAWFIWAIGGVTNGSDESTVYKCHIEFVFNAG